MGVGRGFFVGAVIMALTAIIALFNGAPPARPITFAILSLTWAVLSTSRGMK